jgi:glutamate formiminotransferase/formiminotetrahydrofolate cyclodeaminase
MEKIVECVPNFSEGRDMKIINQITVEIEKVEGVKLLDVDPGRATNRTVVTFAGSPDAVEEAAFAGAKKAAELIDMSRHSGEHARMGATDVCPFVPVSGVTLEECIEISKRVAKRIALELKIPTYLYGKSAKSPERVRLPDIRKGEYEALPEKLQKEEFKPDFGEAVFNEKSGATAVGVRDFLIAYNVNINSKRTVIANKIASRVREKGRKVKNKETGKKETILGTCKGVQGMGWYIEEYNLAQITVNILDYKVTPIYKVFEDCEKFAEQFGVRVTGSEVVGMVPLDSLLDVGLHYLNKQKSSIGVSEQELVRIAIQSLGFNEISEFKPEERIIEYKLRKKGRLASMSQYEFVNELASDSPAPGGGSVAALNGALSAGLSAMVGNLTYSKPKYKAVRKEMIQTSVKGQKQKDFFLNAIDADTDAFNRIMDAFSMPKGTDEEKTVRNSAIQEATKEATLIPFSVLKESLNTVKLALVMTREGNQNSLSDSGVAGLTASAAAHGALYNVMINLLDIQDEAFKTRIVKEAVEINLQVQKVAEEIKEIMYDKLNIN